MNLKALEKTEEQNITWHEGHVDRAERQRLLKQKGCTIWLTGLSASGKSTLAFTLEHALMERNRMAYVLDGDNVRHGLSKNLGFTADDREENIRRIGEVAKLFADAGIITITSFISPYCQDRDLARKIHDDAGLFLLKSLWMRLLKSVRRVIQRGFIKKQGKEKSRALQE